MSLRPRHLAQQAEANSGREGSEITRRALSKTLFSKIFDRLGIVDCPTLKRQRREDDNSESDGSQSSWDSDAYDDSVERIGTVNDIYIFLDKLNGLFQKEKKEKKVILRASYGPLGSTRPSESGPFYFTSSATQPYEIRIYSNQDRNDGSSCDIQQATLGLLFEREEDYGGNLVKTVIIDHIAGYGYVGDCTNPGSKVSGSALMSVLKKIIDIEGVKHMQLYDDAQRTIRGSELEEVWLSPLLKLTTGKAYYERFGFGLFDANEQAAYDKEYTEAKEMPIEAFFEERIRDNPNQMPNSSFIRLEALVKKNGTMKVEKFVNNYAGKYLNSKGNNYKPGNDESVADLEAVVAIRCYLSRPDIFYLNPS